MTEDMMTGIIQSMPNFVGLLLALWFARAQSARQSETIDAQTRAMSELMKEIIECYRAKTE